MHPPFFLNSTEVINLFFLFTKGRSNPKQTKGQDCSQNCQLGIGIATAVCGVTAGIVCFFTAGIGCLVGTTIIFGDLLKSLKVNLSKWFDTFKEMVQLFETVAKYIFDFRWHSMWCPWRIIWVLQTLWNSRKRSKGM